MVRYRVARAESVVLSAQMYGPEEALRVGLVDELAEDPVAVGRARLEALAAHPRAAYSAAKATMRGPVWVRDAASERAFVEEVLPTWTSDELRGRIRAFLDRKR
jgi:enoyl-CoA hydratase/carnithine racemase